MTGRISSLVFFIFTIISLSCAETGTGYELSPEVSREAFYSKPEEIIKKFEKKSENCQKNFILAEAYRNKKDLKKALFYYANSCFDKKYNFSIRLFAYPIYTFVEFPEGRSVFYQDSLYAIASIFYEYNEHEFVLKFTSLMESDRSALYREAVLLRSKSLEKLSRNAQAIDELKKISSLYKDNDSLPMIYIRLGAVYESAGDFYKAADSYLNVIRTGSGIWQNSVAAKRLIILTGDKKIKLDSTEKSVLFASALYDTGDYSRALALADTVLKKEKSPEVEKIRLKIHTIKNYRKALSFLRERESKPEYEGLLLEHANILWDKGKKKDAVKVYDRLSTSADKEISERVLTRLSFFYEERNKPELVRYMELYIKKFPGETQSGRFTWLMGRYYMNTGNKDKAVEYYTRGIKKYPSNSYTSYCRFWLQKIRPVEKKTLDADDIFEELAVNNPDTYHALAMMKLKADATDATILTKHYETAKKKSNMRQMQLFHTLLFIKNGYNNSCAERVKQLDSGLTGPYLEIADLINNPSYSGSYKKLLNKIEIYFYAGDTDSVNREIRLIPENDAQAQKDLALAMTVYSMKHKHYNCSTFYGFRLLNLLSLKENLSLFPEEFAQALYPYAFAECVNEQGRSFQIKPELLLSMMKIESNFNTRAVSPAGAAGLMQLMHPTAAGIAKELGIRKYDLKDPCTSIRFGAKYLSWLNSYYNGQLEYMISAYNAGAGNVNRWKSRDKNQDIDRFSEFAPFDETRDYIFRTKKYLIQYESIYKKTEK